MRFRKKRNVITFGESYGNIINWINFCIKPVKISWRGGELGENWDGWGEALSPVT